VRLQDRLRTATATLAEAGVASPRHDAEALAGHVLGCPRGRLAVVEEISTEAGARFDELLAERARRVPLQYLTGIAAFRYLELAVGPGVFVPRPETEVMTGWVIEQVTGVERPLVVDLCAGSGAVGLAVAAEAPHARVIAVEREPLALAWAAKNRDAEEARGSTPVELVEGDATDPTLLAELDGTVDVVVTNPPYVPLGAQVAPEAADHEPGSALWGGGDGLEVVRALAQNAARLLRPGGLFAVEHAEVQHEMVPVLLRARGWGEVVDHLDLTGRPRFTTARWGSAVRGEA
jgi:release factor glutamine methyltransferase